MHSVHFLPNLELDMSRIVEIWEALITTLHHGTYTSFLCSMGTQNNGSSSSLITHPSTKRDALEWTCCDRKWERSFSYADGPITRSIASLIDNERGSERGVDDKDGVWGAGLPASMGSQLVDRLLRCGSHSFCFSCLLVHLRWTIARYWLVASQFFDPCQVELGLPWGTVFASNRRRGRERWCWWAGRRNWSQPLELHGEFEWSCEWKRMRRHT